MPVAQFNVRMDDQLLKKLEKRLIDDGLSRQDFVTCAAIAYLSGSGIYEMGEHTDRAWKVRIRPGRGPAQLKTLMKE